ncbi:MULTISPECIES: zinc-ribbon domain-containing protein [Roseomonadaceae]|uniref:Zinc-ribbon domain-containing protein n=1 Tax=Falsiroseomonas oleicola TaxID=2801474 RepID=A0ABS6H746_9PROT|nr:zinc-ribbon domain-containing protein [Roseomonas oleicola]MBU8544519.1 zinc-ribbon domain-containing protein [Roseomonas oleicola]
MRISCPNCAAEYDVPDQALAAGPRLLRCARCQHRFEAALPAPPAAESRAETAGAAGPPMSPEAPDDTPQDLPADVPEAASTPLAAPTAQTPERLAAAPASPPDRFALAGWLLTVLLLAAAGYAGFAFRAEVMAAWPPAQRLYGLLGLG